MYKSWLVACCNYVTLCSLIEESVCWHFIFHSFMCYIVEFKSLLPFHGVTVFLSFSFKWLVLMYA